MERYTSKLIKEITKMKILNLVIKIIAVIMILKGLFLLFGVVLFLIDVINGIEHIPATFYTQVPYYILLIVSAVGILKSKKWGIYLLFTLLAYDICYWGFLGFYQKIFHMMLSAKTYTGRLILFLYLFYERFLVPIFLFIFFSLPKVREEFSQQKKADKDLK